MKAPRVLHIIPSVAASYGGPSQAIYTTCRALRDRGIEPLIATTNADGSGELPVALGEKIVYREVATIFFARGRSNALKYSRALALWLSDNIKNFDLAHIHDVFTHVSVAAAGACRRRRVPYLVRPLGTLDPWSLRQKRIRKRLFWHLGVKQMLRGAAAIHYTTVEEKRLAESTLSLTRGVVVPNGVDLSMVERPVEPFWRQRPELGNSPYILALSRIHPKKGFELLIESFAALKSHGSFGDWRLVFAGDGDANYVDQLKALARRKGLSGDAIFVGWLEGAGKYAALKGASLLAMPSYQENFGISAAEAMACGVPVLVSPHVNLAPEIEEAGAGWVAELSKEHLSRTLAEALLDEQERKYRGDRARAMAQNFAAPAVAKRLLDLYQSLVEN